MNAVTPVHVRDIQTVITRNSLCNKNLPVEKTYIVTNIKAREIIDKQEGLIFIDENEMYEDLSYESIKQLLDRRGVYEGYTGWYLQQFIKMAFSFICEDDYYLIWDADLLPVNFIDLFNEMGKPYFTTKRENHKPYFDTINTLFNGTVGRETDASFICEHMVIKTSIMREMIRVIEANDDISGKYFYEKIIWAINFEDITNSGFSEYETYGNYVMKYYGNLYELRRLRTFRHALMVVGNKIEPKVINWISNSYDMVAFENKEKKSIISFILNSNMIMNRYYFRQVTHWYMKYMYGIDVGIQNINQNISDYFWRGMRYITEKAGVYSFLKDLQTKKKEG